MDLNYKKHLNNAMYSSLYSFDSPINQYLNYENQEFVKTEHTVWILGVKYDCSTQFKEILNEFRSRIWISYRKNFASIGGDGPTSDQGWGCMLRCGQMVLAQAFILNKLSREWRWIGCDKFFLDKTINEIENKESETKNELSKLIRDEELLLNQEEKNEYEIYMKILKQFQDKKTSPYSIHQITLMGSSRDKPIGTWFGPNTIAQTLKKLSMFDHVNDYCIHVALDNMVIIEDLFIKCIKNLPQSSSSEENIIWKPLLLFIPLRLGLSEINSIYFDDLKTTFKIKSTLGIIGGKPNHALYFIGYSNNELIYLDPHRTQNMVDLDETKLLDSILSDLTYHCKNANKMNIAQLDPSISLCFFFKTRLDFDEWCTFSRDVLLVNKKCRLFELNEAKMKPWVCVEAEDNIDYSDYDLANNVQESNTEILTKSCDIDDFELLG